MVTTLLAALAFLIDRRDGGLMPVRFLLLASLVIPACLLVRLVEVLLRLHRHLCRLGASRDAARAVVPEPGAGSLGTRDTVSHHATLRDESGNQDQAQKDQEPGTATLGTWYRGHGLMISSSKLRIGQWLLCIPSMCCPTTTCRTSPRRRSGSPDSTVRRGSGAPGRGSSPGPRSTSPCRTRPARAPRTTARLRPL